MAVAAIVAAAGVLAHRYASRSLPVVNGSIEVAGVSAPVDIVRDASAIPHIFGATRRDTLFGLGYVHAQDRLWQMEFQRRIGFGRLSEIFGAATVALPSSACSSVNFGALKSSNTLPRSSLLSSSGWVRPWRA